MAIMLDAFDNTPHDLDQTEEQKQKKHVAYVRAMKGDELILYF